MDSDTGIDPLDGVEDIDWRSRVPGGGGAIPVLLRGLATEDEALESALALGELLNYPGPGHVAVPHVVDFLVNLALVPEAPATYQVLCLLHEFATGAPGDHIPKRRDPAAWRDEVAWVRSVSREEAIARYEEWLAEAADEQQYRRFRTQLRALRHENGPEILASELAAYEAIQARVPELLTLLSDRDLRIGEFVPQEAANLLGLFPEQAEQIIPVLRSMERATFVAPEDFASAVFSIGTLADPADTATASYLARQLLPKPGMFDSDSVRFSAGLALIHLLGEEAPQQALQAVLPELANTRMVELFPSPYADIGNNTFVFLTAGLAGEQAKEGKLDAYPELFEKQGELLESDLLIADVLETAFGPRTAQSAKAEFDDFDGYEPEQQEALWALTELSEEAWAGCGAAETLEAWGLPGDRGEFLAFTGADGDSEAPPEEAAPESAESGR